MLGVYCNKHGQLHALRRMWADDYGETLSYRKMYKHHLLRQYHKDSNENLEDSEQEINSVEQGLGNIEPQDDVTQEGATGGETVAVYQMDISESAEHVVFDRGQ